MSSPKDTAETRTLLAGPRCSCLLEESDVPSWRAHEDAPAGHLPGRSASDACKAHWIELIAVGLHEVQVAEGQGGKGTEWAGAVS